jgi:hypothetical protein
VSDHHLFEFLTREEWRMCYAVQFLDDFEEYADAFDLDRFATPGEEGDPDTYEESFRRAIRFLALEHGFEFKALRPREDGSIYAEEPIEARNRVYVSLLQTGGAPDIPGCLRELLERAPPSLSTDPIVEAIHEVETVAKDIERKAGEQRPEIEQEISRREQALASWGVVTGNGKGMIH